VSPIVIEWDETAVRDLERRDPLRRRQVRNAVERLAASTPTDVLRHKNVRRLAEGLTPPRYRLHIGPLRAIFIRTEHGIRIQRVLPRPDAYRR
jgi:hypothetical protein